MERVMGIEPMSHPLSMDLLVFQSVLIDQFQCSSSELGRRGDYNDDPLNFSESGWLGWVWF